ncbi:MAG: VTT domain-containing protein [Oscillospiraceae bacterium]|jgi:uncharacterized membrane protein YdjX (TVP38/TMEM64 family)|nr:VTT domain-containing protein [Oscillospiraceae bacterium]
MNNVETAHNTKSYLKRRRIVGMVSIIVVLLLTAGLSLFLYNMLLEKVDTPEEFRDYISGFGWKGRFVFLGLQCLQVVVALIPGEIIEMGAGYAFGPLEGTLLCMAGVAIASSFIFMLTKRWGIRLVELVISREKINELRFINNERKLKRTIFILFFVPGTPKDIFTYFAGLTRIRLHEFLVISILARIPSVVSSTIFGHVVGSQNYLFAVILFAVTGLISIGGMTLYSHIIRKRQ